MLKTSAHKKHVFKNSSTTNKTRTVLILIKVVSENLFGQYIYIDVTLLSAPKEPTCGNHTYISWIVSERQSSSLEPINSVLYVYILHIFLIFYIVCIVSIYFLYYILYVYFLYIFYIVCIFSIYFSIVYMVCIIQFVSVCFFWCHKNTFPFILDDISPPDVLISRVHQGWKDTYGRIVYHFTFIICVIYYLL